MTRTDVVDTDALKHERKKEYVSAEQAGMQQTLNKGNAMDWLNELVWDSREKIDEIIAFFEGYRERFVSKREVAENIPEKPFVLDTEKTEVEVTIRPEMKEIGSEDEVQSEDVVVSEEVVSAEHSTDESSDAEENVTDSKILEDIEAQIAALEAKKAELEE